MQKITYLNECLQQSGLLRWPEKLMPIPVYIAPFKWYKSKNSDAAQYKYRGMVIEAFNIWSKATDGLFRFVIVDKLFDSYINLDWRRVDRTSLGNCSYNWDKYGRGCLVSADIQIGLSDGIIHEQYMNDNEVRHTIIHEIGHGLGLQHSPFKNDIMFVPHQYGVVNVSQCDKNTMKWLYKLPYGKSPAEIIKTYFNGEAKSIDEMIYLMTTQNQPSKFQGMVDDFSNNKAARDLLEENENLGNLNLYNMSLAQIELSKEAKDFAKKMKYDKSKGFPTN